MVMKLMVLVVLFASSECAKFHQANRNSCVVGEDAPVFIFKGDLQLTLLVRECNNSDVVYARTLVNSAIWTTERLNFLEFTGPLRLGLTAFKVCNENDYYSALFKVFTGAEDALQLGVISDRKFTDKMKEFAGVLEVDYEVTTKYWSYLVKASVRLLDALDLQENVTVVASREDVLMEFFRQSRKHWVCVQHCMLLNQFDSTTEIPKIQGTILIFGDQHDIRTFMNYTNYEEQQMIFVPLDGSQLTVDVPDLSYVIQPYYPEYQSPYRKDASIITTPLLFEVANPILNLAENISKFNCSEPTQKADCLKDNLFRRERTARNFQPNQLADVLKIELLKRKFVYNVFRVENVTVFQSDGSQNSSVLQTFVKTFTYNIFYDVLFDVEANAEVNRTFVIPANAKSFMQCANFASQSNYTSRLQPRLKIRSEAWIFGFWVLSFLGMLFCISVFIFLTVRMFKKEVFEGNPFLTVLLLISLCFMYFSVLPFTVEGNQKTREGICVIRSLCLTLSFAAAFSLMLGRSILLASVANEIGIMSHIAGPVQSFLTLFIFGVQGALSIHVFGHCQEIYKSASFVYYLSYNIILLGLLVCFCPLVYKSQRNYREGKYFTIATVAIAGIWCCWIPLFLLLDDYWKDPILCFALIATASLILSGVFIPRTYLITIAEARDKLTGALPALATMTSTFDIYKNGIQQNIYDCVNVAAISAYSGDGLERLPRFNCDLYSTPPDVAEEGDYQYVRTSTPVDSDKVTRF